MSNLRQTISDLSDHRAELLEIYSILENIDRSFISVNRNWDIIYINERAASSIGRKSADLKGKNLWLEFPQFVGTKEEEIFRKVMDEKVAIEIEGIGVITGRWNQEKAYPTANGIAIAWADITERKKAEESLKQSEALYRTLFDNSEDGFMLLEPIFDKNGAAQDFRFLKLNSAYERQTGANAQDVIGKLASQVTPDLEPEITVLSGKVVKTGKSTHNEAYNRYSNKWFDSYYFPYSETQVGILFRDITERKKAEQSLKEKTDELNRILDSAPTIIFHKDKQGKFIQANKAFAQALKVSKEDLLGKTVFDLYSPEIAQQMTSDDIAVMNSINPKIGTIEPYESPTGLRWIRTDKIPSFDEKGEVNGIIGFSEEITERKIAEEALRESEERFRSVLNHSIDGVYRLNLRTGKYDYLSPAIKALTGFEPEEIMAMSSKQVLSRVHPDDSRMLEIFLAGLIEKGKGTFDYRFLGKDGKYRWLSNQLVIIEDKDGKPLYRDGFLRDITDRKETEDALKQSEERYRTLFSSIGEAFGLHEMLFDDQGIPYDYRFLEVNGAFEKHTGLRASEILGKTVCEVLPDLEPFWIKTYGKVVVTGEPVKFENFNRSLKRHFEVYAFRPVEGRFAVIFTDITERKKAEEALKGNERMAAIGQTAGMVGHDLRNPLQTITGEVYLAKSELDSLPDSKNKTCLQESIQTIETQVVYMDKIVSDLQTFVRPVEAKFEIVELGQLLTGLLAQMDIPKNIQAYMQVDEGLVVEADGQLLKRVLINLVTNAVQAMPDGGELTLRGQNCDKRVQIIIEDTGTGIPDEIKSKIFMPLFTTKSKGQGFGLAVCKRVIEAQHGTISFESEVGRGTKFKIVLPITQ